MNLSEIWLKIIRMMIASFKKSPRHARTFEYALQFKLLFKLHRTFKLECCLKLKNCVLSHFNVFVDKLLVRVAKCNVGFFSVRHFE